jgi:ABC-type transporter Mla subunit MlaD
MTSTELDAFDDVRQLTRKTAAFTRAAANVLDDVIDVDDDDSRERLEDLAHLLGAATEAADAAVKAGAQLALDACNNRRREDV